MTSFPWPPVFSPGATPSPTLAQYSNWFHLILSLLYLPTSLRPFLYCIIEPYPRGNKTICDMKRTEIVFNVLALYFLLQTKELYSWAYSLLLLLHKSTPWRTRPLPTHGSVYLHTYGKETIVLKLVIYTLIPTYYWYFISFFYFKFLAAWEF